MSQQLDFLKEQAECLQYIFEHIKVLELEIKVIKRGLKANKLSLDCKYYLLLIDNEIKRLSILISEFNKSEFTNVRRERVDEMFKNIIYGSRIKKQNLRSDSQ